MDSVYDVLDSLFENPKCELEYNKDYELLIAVVLSAQTTDKAVNLVTRVLFDKYPSLESLANADLGDIKKIIKPIGTFNKKALYVKEIANQLIKRFNSSIPKNHNDLESLPGVGHKSANVVLGVLYNYPTFAVDTHVSRVSKRLGLVSRDDNVDKIEGKLKKIVPKERWIRTHHQLVLFGRYYCKAKNPECNNCRLKDMCCKEN